MKTISCLCFLLLVMSNTYSQSNADSVLQMNGCVYIPNVLTPDCNDWDCDQLQVYACSEIFNYEFTIYSKYGKLIYSSHDIKDIWYPSRQSLSDQSLFWILEGFVEVESSCVPIKWSGIIYYVK